MIKSMTGFGRAEVTDDKRVVVCEIKSVNHRYCDISVKMPRRYSFAEERVKQAIKEVVSRGKLDVSVMVDNIGEGDTAIRLNTELAKKYVENLRELQKEVSLDGDATISLEFLAGLPDVLKTIPDVEDEEEIISRMQPAQTYDAQSLAAMFGAPLPVVPTEL